MWSESAKQLHEEISLHEISIADASSHPRYRAMLQKAPVASLQIPNKLFLLWSAKQSLQKKLFTSVSKHYEMVNDSIVGGKLNPVRELNLRLQKEASRAINKSKKLRREAKCAFESKISNFLVYDNEICLTNASEKENNAPVAEKGFKFKGV